MKNNFILFALISISSVFVLHSCNTEDDILSEITSRNESTIKKEFEISESWFNNDSLKLKSLPTGDIYNNFGEGLNCITHNSRHSVFNVQNSLEPLIATTLEEKTTFRYTSTNNYSAVDTEVKSELAAALGVDVKKVELDASLSITNSSRISQDSKSIYVNVLYVKRYGKGRFQFSHPTINNYLLYSTNLHNPEESDDNINLSNEYFRNTYGDQFKSIITFGCLLNATIQITNVDFDGEQKEVVEADAKAKIGKWVEMSASWESLSNNSRYFHSSSLMIDGTIIPHGGLILNHDDLISEINKLDQLYSNHDLGVILNAYENYSSLYPTYNFINYQFYIDQLKKIKRQIYYYTWFVESFGRESRFLYELEDEYDKYYNLQTTEPFNENLWISRFLTMCRVYHIDPSSIPFYGQAYSLWEYYN